MKAIPGFLYNYVQFEDPETNSKFEEEIDKITRKTKTMDFFEALAEYHVLEGIDKGKRETIENLLKNYNVSDKEIAAMVKVPIAFVRKVKAELQKK